ncbi:MAG: hypothetical protein PV344_00265, partial [Anaplasma sp.]|nr:hypothetical protein [Anaplasma sp.]
MWFSNSLVTISSIRNDQARTNALAVLQREFPTSSGEYKICSSCKDSLVAGKVPPMSVSYGYTYPPKPDHLPPLNPVEERLIAPRLPFMSIRRLTHGNGQYGIKGQVVNVPINVPTTVQCLPRNIPDDVAIDVHLKRRLVCKPSYKKGLVKKRNIHEWLKHLEHSPLYKYLKIKIDWGRKNRWFTDDSLRSFAHSSSFTTWICCDFFLPSFCISALSRPTGISFLAGTSMRRIVCGDTPLPFVQDG